MLQQKALQALPYKLPIKKEVEWPLGFCTWHHVVKTLQDGCSLLTVQLTGKKGLTECQQMIYDL